MKSLLLPVLKSTFVTSIATAMLWLIFTVPVMMGSLDLYWIAGWIVVVLPVIVVVYAICIFLGQLVVAVPLYKILTRFSITTCYPYALVGFFLPLVIVYLCKSFGDDPLLYQAFQGVGSGVLGLLCAFIFWLEAVKRPDQLT